MSGLAPLYVPELLREATSDRAWVQALLDAELALARACAAAGVVPAGVPAAVEPACDAAAYDVGALLEQGRAVANPGEPVVRALRERVTLPEADYVHWGATSQDVVDTAAMLVATRALGPILAGLDRLAGRAASLAEEHRETLMPARTLLQQAVPTTFGLKASGWLTACLDARARLAAVRRDRLAAQLGGAAGTLAAYGGRGLDVLRLFAGELGLAAPERPWHTDRSRLSELAAALAAAAEAAAKPALDVVLLAQTEVGEVAEAAGGASSTMPQKRNPAGSVLVLACARLARTSALALLAPPPHEHERAAGAWQSEWPALTSLLGYTGGALDAAARALDGLTVDAGRMRANLDATGGAALAERLSFLLTPRLGRARAQERLRPALQAAGSPAGLREALLADGELGLSPAEVDEALDPSSYTGSAGTLVDRALERYREEAA